LLGFATRNGRAVTEKLALGQLVIFTKQLKREKEDEGERYSRTWVETTVLPPQSRAGFVMGIRTVCDTKMVYDEEYGGDSYRDHFNYRKVAIVSYSLSRKPALVPLDAITVING
jgi:hypothetical protein